MNSRLAKNQFHAYSHLNKNSNKTTPKRQSKMISEMIHGDNDSESFIFQFFFFLNFTIFLLSCLQKFQLYFCALNFLAATDITGKRNLRKFFFISSACTIKLCFLMSDSVSEQSSTENEKMKIFLLRATAKKHYASLSRNYIPRLASNWCMKWPNKRTVEIFSLSLKPF
jgi:hypothetical protein